MRRHALLTVLLWCSVPLHVVAQSQTTPEQMGEAAYLMNAMIACAEAKPDALESSRVRALETARLLRNQEERERGIQRAHTELVKKGGCAGFPAEEQSEIARNIRQYADSIRSNGGAATLSLPADWGGEVSGRASYGTIGVGTRKLYVLCAEEQRGTQAGTRVVFISTSPRLFEPGNHNLAEIGARTLLIRSPEGTVRGEHTQVASKGITDGVLDGGFVAVFQSSNGRPEVVTASVNAVAGIGACGSEEVLASISSSGPSDPDMAARAKLAALKQHCANEWPTDYDMRAYCEKRQYEAIAELIQLAETRGGGIPETVFVQMLDRCTAEWPADYPMTAYCLKRQVDGYWKTR